MKKKASVFSLLSTAVLFLLLSGCQKGIVDNQTNPSLSPGKQNATLSPLGTPPDVYVAGSDNGQAVYWKNGTKVDLSGGTQATGIVVAGSNVYVCGYGTSS